MYIFEIPNLTCSNNMPGIFSKTLVVAGAAVVLMGGCNVSLRTVDAAHTPQPREASCGACTYVYTILMHHDWSASYIYGGVR